MSWINGDEGELDALATYLEAVQVFLHQRCYIEQPWAPSLGTKMTACASRSCYSEPRGIDAQQRAQHA